jgi:hypothetical protein
VVVIGLPARIDSSIAAGDRFSNLAFRSGILAAPMRV